MFDEQDLGSRAYRSEERSSQTLCPTGLVCLAQEHECRVSTADPAGGCGSPEPPLLESAATAPERMRRRLGAVEQRLIYLQK